MAEPENSKVRGEGTEEADTNKEVKNMILVDNQSHESEDHKEVEEDYKSDDLKEYVEDQSGQDQSPGQEDKLNLTSSLISSEDSEVTIQYREDKKDQMMKADIVIIPETQDDTSDQLTDKDTQDDIPDTPAETQDTSDKSQDKKNGEKRGKDTSVPEDQAEDSIETLKVLFADTLLQYIDKRTERGKTNLKWDGEPSQLKDFITLILKRNGQWKPRKAGAGKQMFVFQDKSENITLNFWQSSKALTVQGDEDQAAKIEEQLDNLVNSMRPELKKIEAQIHNPKKVRKRTSNNHQLQKEMKEAQFLLTVKKKLQHSGKPSMRLKL